MAVLNPFTRVDARIMDDADLAGPILFCLSFAMFLLFVRNTIISYIRRCGTQIVFYQSGKAQFNYIYGVGVLGSVSIYVLLNLMSDAGIDAYRVCSILGYCLLPMVGIGAVSVMFTLEYVYPSSSSDFFVCETVLIARQWHGGISALVIEHRMVHMGCVGYFRCSAAHVGSEVAGGLPRGVALWLLCTTECI